MSGAFPGDLTVEIAFDGVTWIDVSAKVRAVTYSRQSTPSDGVARRYKAGTASITLDNTDRRFDPTHLTGPYTVDGVTLVQPGVPVRISVTYGTQVYRRFTGRVRSWPIQWGKVWSTEITVPATDAAADLEAVKLAPLVDDAGEPAPVGAGELSGDRVNRILDAAGFAGPRVVAGGSATMQGTVFGRSAWQELLLVADSEGGDVFVDGAGSVVFRSRGDVFTAPRSVLSQSTFSDAL